MNFLFELLGFYHHDAFVLCIIYARTIVPTILMILGLHILIISPQKKQRAWLKAIALELKDGVFIVTSAGIQGKVLYLLEHSVIIECHNGEKMEILKQSIISINR